MVADLTVSLSASNKGWSQSEWHMNYTIDEYDKVGKRIQVLPKAENYYIHPLMSATLES
jgi:hypothetical protein